MKNFYSVEFLSPETNAIVVSRYFQTLKGARNWAKWCRKTFSQVRIMKGGPGGMEVA